MRTIKFRGKSLKNGEWFYGNLFNEDINGRIHISTTKRGCLNIDRKTVGQFTGLTDKNGKEIYEGDVMRFTTEFGEVITGVTDDDILGIIYIVEAMNAEIIGNIHDNPELLINK